MADGDTRMLNFAQRFGMESHLPECKALSAPGLQERFGHLPTQIPKSIARAVAAEDSASAATHSPNTTPADEKSAQAKKRARQKANKAAKRALTNGPAPLAILDKNQMTVKKDGGKPGGKGQKRGGGGSGAAVPLPPTSGIPPIPKKIKPKHEGKRICFAYNQHRNCKQNPCNFAHVCYWCGDTHPGGQEKKCC